MSMDKPDQLFKALSDETRLRILNLLAQREHCVCEFQAILRIPQPRISRHLAYLRRTGLVEVNKCGRWVTYSLAKPRNSVHASLVQCIKSCFREIDFLQRDIGRGRKTAPVKCV
jgi:ArsR family transcriptional regulator